MRFVVSNDIKIYDPDERVKAWCQANLVLDNPDFYKKDKIGKWTGNTPKEIFLYERKGNELVVPFGCFENLWKLVPDKRLWSAEIHEMHGRKYKNNINLYGYQEKAVKTALSRRNGVLVMPCGSGKTQCGIEMICRIGGKALWLTHTQDLLNQSMNRAKSVLDMSEGAFGTITAGRVNLGTHITFATVQTMCKIDLQKYKDDFDVVIIDEVQHCAGTPTRVTQFYQVVTNLSARYKYGLTATPKRADGLEKAMFAIVGNIVHTVDKKEVENNTCPIKVKKIETGYMPDYSAVLMGDGTIDYSKVIDDMIHNHDRFEKVLSEIPEHCPTLVLGNRVEYLNRMCEEYKKRGMGKAVCLSGMTASKLSKEIRKRALASLNNGELDCIFATYQLAKEGLDVPKLLYIVFATPEKDETTIIQSAGRVGRKADGKEFGTVIDLIDDFAMYRGWSKKRDGYYRKIEAEIY